ncbi:response regulator [Salininema proteolyticum]|uniref:Response regulator n=1 Tax=Salininema proteolyticum TaxID=1607685 RepID=A0ABV8TVL7_9ACTN
MNESPRPIDVLIVDDQSLIRDGLSRIINAQSDMRTAGIAADGKQAISRVRELRPDVVLMDVRMPVLDGIEATRKLIGDRVSPSTRILGLTTHDRDAYAIRMFKAGAIGFIIKDGTATQLVTAIRSAHNGTFTAAESTTQRLLKNFDTDAPTPPPANCNALDSLTNRERTVFDLVVAGASNPEIARDLYIAEVTVKTHVGRILAKINVRDRVALVIWAHRQGLANTGTRERKPWEAGPVHGYKPGGRPVGK